MLAKYQYSSLSSSLCGCLKPRASCLPWHDRLNPETVSHHKHLFSYFAFVTDACNLWHPHCEVQISPWRGCSCSCLSVLSAPCCPPCKAMKTAPKEQCSEGISSRQEVLQCEETEICGSLSDFPFKRMWPSVESGTIMKNKQTANVWLPTLFLNILPKHFQKRN